jgi:glycosyltransferase involved in cell wall biosynthesis
VELSIVIPVFNEEASVEPLVERLSAVLPTLPAPHEVVFVDDGSRDATGAKLLAARALRPWLRIVTLRRNFGQHIATYAGFDHARGRILVTLDGDLQNDPADIPRIVDKLKEGYDVVCGRRRDRQDAFLSRRLPSRVVNWVIARHSATPIHDYGCFLRGYTREAADEISKYSSSRSWFPVMFGKLGLRVSEIDVQHHARARGDASRHDFLKRAEQFLSILIGATDNPFLYVVLAGVLALALSALGLVGMLLALAFGTAGQALLWAAGSLAVALWGALATVTGVVGEYIARVHHEIGRTPRYVVRDVK